MAIEMIPVSSSNVGEVGYDAEAQALHVRYLNNRTYVYSDVPGGVFQELLSAPSIGSFLNRVVKGTYLYHEL
ncbi:MAG: KTSC domain-containing protein [Actinomycetota bacterium]